MSEAALNDAAIARRNALVGVHDKRSELADRAVHEWSAEVFRAPDRLLSAQYRLMVRTDRNVAAAATRRRGAELRTWEDVADGDALAALVVRFADMETTS